MKPNKLQDLLRLAEEPSSQRRRELLREVTDMFFASAELNASLAEQRLFDDVMTQLTGEMEEEVRVELAGKMAHTTKAPINLIRSLAADTIAVAGPVLTHSPVLTETDQLKVASGHSQDHLRALSKREGVSMAVSDAIVSRGDDTTLEVLLRNASANLSRQAHETVVDRAQANPDLHEVVVDRHSLPSDLLNEMYFMVEARLRERILARNTDLDPIAVNAALEVGRKRIETRDGSLPVDYDASEAAIQALKARGGIPPALLASFLRNHETTKFLIALADLGEIDFHTAKHVLDSREIDALAIICKAAGLDRALFLTFAILLLDRDADAMGKSRTYGELYAALPRETAQRTIRFWRMRRQTSHKAA